MDSINAKRIYSFLVDSIALSFIGIVISVALSVERNLDLGAFGIFGLSFKYGYALQGVFVVLYFAAFDFCNAGNTLGKLLFSISVVEKGLVKKPSVENLLKRTCYKTVSVAILPASVLLFLFRDGFTIQDKLTNTITIKT